MKGLFLILLAYLAGNLLSGLLGGVVPGSVLGMIVLFSALKAKVVKAQDMSGIVNLLLDNMMLFFVPVGVGLMTSYTLIGGNIWAIMISLVVSTVLVILIVGWVQQKAGTLHPRRYMLVRRRGHAIRKWRKAGFVPAMAMVMKETLNSPLFLLTLTVGVYYGALVLYRRTKWNVLHPLLVSMVVIILFLKWAGIDYMLYYEANGIINFMLGLSVVALGYLLYENFEQIRGKELSILFSIFIGSVVGVVSVVLIARWLGAGPEIVASLGPKSVTTPIALAVSQNSGGIPALTSVAVIVAGIFGSIAGPWLMKVAGIRQSVARGLAMGAASHAMGTAKAMELGAVEGAIGGAAIGLMGVMTSLIVPVTESFM